MTPSTLLLQFHAARAVAGLVAAPDKKGWRPGAGFVVAAGDTDASAAGGAGGEDADLVAGLRRRAAAAGQKNLRRCVIILGRPDYALVRLELPPGTAGETAAMVELELAATLPLDATRYCYGWEKVGASAEGREAIQVYWTPVARIEAQLETARAAGLEVAAVYPSLALYRRIVLNGRAGAADSEDGENGAAGESARPALLLVETPDLYELACWKADGTARHSRGRRLEDCGSSPAGLREAAERDLARLAAELAAAYGGEAPRIVRLGGGWPSSEMAEAGMGSALKRAKDEKRGADPRLKPGATGEPAESGLNGVESGLNEAESGLNGDERLTPLILAVEALEGTARGKGAARGNGAARETTRGRDTAGQQDAEWGKRKAQGRGEAHQRGAGGSGFESCNMLPRAISDARQWALARRLGAQTAALAAALVLLVVLNVVLYSRQMEWQLEDSRREIERITPVVKEIEGMEERIRSIREQIDYTMSPLDALVAVGETLRANAALLEGLYLDHLTYKSTGEIALEGHAVSDITPWSLAQLLGQGGLFEITQQPRFDIRQYGETRSIRFSAGLRARAAQAQPAPDSEPASPATTRGAARGEEGGP